MSGGCMIPMINGRPTLYVIDAFPVVYTTDTGPIDANTLRTTLATNDPAVLLLGDILDANAGALQLPVTHWSSVDGTVAFTTNVTLTCAGFPFVVADANCTVAFILYKPAAGVWTRLVNGVSGVSITAAANVITVVGAGTPFAAGDIYVVGLCQQQKGYEVATNSFRSNVIASVLPPDAATETTLAAILAASGAASQLPITHWSSVDGTVTYTSNITLTCAGFPFTVEDATCTVAYILYKPLAGVWTRLINGTGGVSITSAANVITVAGAGTPFAATDIYVIGLSYQQKGFIAANNALRSEQINDSQLKYGFDYLSVTNMTSGTYYFPVDMEGCNFVTFQIIGSGGTPTDVLTLTLECSAQNDGTAMLSCTYRDRTSELLGFVSVVDPTSEWWELWGTAAKWIRIKYVAAGGANDSDLIIFAVKGQM